MDEILPNQLQSLGDDELEIPIFEDGGQVKSTVPGLLGSIDKSGYSVFFQRIYEVHGSTENLDTDNATFLVIKVSPRAKGDNHQFKKFNVTLEVTPAPGSEPSDDNPVYISYEPAQEGVWFIKEHTTIRTVGSEVEANAGGEIPGGLSLGFVAKKSFSEESQRRVLHTVSAEESYSRRTENLPDIVTWKLKPANNADGIGDYMAIALLVKRRSKSQFVIKVRSDASLGSIIDKRNSWLGRGKDTYLGPFGPGPGDGREQPKPPGVDENNLKDLASKGLLQTFAFVHVPEKVEAEVKYSERGKAVTPNTVLREADTVSSLPSARGEEPGIQTQTQPHSQSTSKVLPLSNTMASTTRSKATNPSTPIFEQSSVTIMPSSPTKAAAYPSNSSQLSSARAMRHRKMAALYQRLAQLHREEAEEAEGWAENQYADAAEMQGLHG